MLKRVLALCIAALVLVGIPAYAEGAPAITDQNGQAVGFTVSESTQTAPEAGDWNQYAEILNATDEALVDSFRTQMAIKATDLDFNSYALMTYAEKASVVVALLDYQCGEGSYSFYGEGDSAANNSILPTYAAVGGDFAVFTLKDGAWMNVGMFALTNDTNANNPYFLADLSCYDVGDAPAYLGWYDTTAALWHVVGVNQAFVDAAIALVF